MMRSLTALLVGLVIMGTASAAPAKKIIIRWHGQSYFEIISSKGTRIVTDPHNIEALGHFETQADVVTESHNHNDHTMDMLVKMPDRSKIFKGWTVNGKKVDWNLIDEKVGDVHLRTVGVYHDDSQGAERGKNTVFIFDVDGLHIVHLGDLGHLLTPQQIKQIGPVDILMIPVGGVYTINGTEAKEVVEQLKPKWYIFPMHYGLQGFDELLPLDEFLEDQDKANIKRLPKTNEFIVDLSAKPAHPTIVLLNYKKPTGDDE